GGSAAFLTILLGRILWFPAQALWRPIASKRWSRRLAREAEARPRGQVVVVDAQGQPLGKGPPWLIGATHTGVALPLARRRTAAAVEDGTGREIKGATFYFGPSSWVVRGPRRQRVRA